MRRMSESDRWSSQRVEAARCCLMLHHTQGIDVSIADAFDECQHAFHRMDESGLDDHARTGVARIKELMDTRGIADPAEEGTWKIKARS